MVLLDGTTIEEVEQYHLKTVRLAVNAANTAETQRMEREKEAAAKKGDDEEAHRKRVEEVVDRLKFDDGDPATRPEVSEAHPLPKSAVGRDGRAGAGTALGTAVGP